MEWQITRLIKQPSSYEKFLINKLSSTDDDVACWAAYELGEIGGPESYDPLVKSLVAQSPMLRHNALNALNHRDKSDLAVDSAIKILNKTTEEPFVVDSAISLLAKVKMSENKIKAVIALKQLSEKHDTTNTKYNVHTAIKILE